MSEEFFDRAEFVQYFKDETDELLQTIDSALLRLESFVDSDEIDAEIVNELFRAMHTIKGSGGMLGFVEVQELAHRLESVFDLLRKDRMPLSQQSIDLLFEGRDILTALIRALTGEAIVPEGVDGYIQRLESFSSLYEATAAIVAGEAGGGDMHGLERLDATEEEIAAFEAEVARLLEGREEGADASTESGAAEAPSAAPEPRAREVRAEARQEQRRNLSQTIRVDIERLDSLLSLVGELVINRTRISDIAATLGRSLSDFKDLAVRSAIEPLTKELADSAGLLARTTNEIQEGIMKVRMVPIGQVFERFPRMVRDLSKARKKEVRLEIRGAETDLDKTVVDEIGEPLMHLIRNCVDHGIEEAEARRSAGKPEVGTIRLNAYHEGNQIIIEVGDDGRGINLARVREKGIRAGLISESEKLTDREIMELIFQPGFSTAEKVTDISGRGVGMDVVKKNIARLKGVFDIDSSEGVGATFTIKLPLTLAIIQALLVRVGGELYSIPLDSVIESQRVEMSEVRTVHGSEVITLRGSVVPLLRIGEFFGLGTRRDPDKVMIVIVSVQGRQVGLVVDSFQGEQEIVIKPLSDVIGRISGISGATILGNGSISLIIDVHSMVSEAYTSGRVARAEYAAV
ncbi:MAG TPA: chemotaxis protein CheA [Candidatus Dormibacteraeota bacterium]|nr:chemotaxis protein CheA [Candidatus Dormibacteraeota bacterium]